MSPLNVYVLGKNQFLIHTHHNSALMNKSEIYMTKCILKNKLLPCIEMISFKHVVIHDDEII